MNINRILSFLFSTIPEKQVKYVIWYGNRKGKDIDLFVVLNGKNHFDSLVIGPLDVGCVGDIWIPTMIKHLDPIITEPLLTGRVIWGQASQEKRDLLNQTIDKNTVSYLLQCTEMFYDWALKHMSKRKFRKALLTLCFVHSYILYTRWYYKEKKLVLFNDLLSSDDGLWIRQAREMVKKHKRIFRSDVHQACIETKKMLTDLRITILCRE